MRALLLVALLAACSSKKQEAPAAGSGSAAVHVEAAPLPKEESAALAKAQNNFALEMWQKAPPQGNLAISPTSITIALTMIWAGAKGDTGTEMASVLHFDGAPDHVVSRWGQLAQALQSPSRPFELHLANRLFADKHREYDTVFFDINMKAFGARLDMMDFAADGEGSRQKINTWVAQETKDKIKELLPPQSVQADTKLVAVNAIYFLAKWATPFKKEQTYAQDFHGVAVSKVDMMHLGGRFSYAHEAGAAMLQLPYRGGDVAMYVVLPDAVDGLPALEASLKPTLEALQTKVTDQQVVVALPRFTIDSSVIELGNVLKALGMKLAFDGAKADLSGISKPGTDRLYLSSVLHKAYVRVDEDGTEAAAATAVMTAGTGAAPAPPVQFTADHPFLFLIVDKPTGLILFMGRVVEP